MNLDIKKIFIHPKYVNRLAYFDVAILVTEPLNVSTSIQPICLPVQATDSLDFHEELEVQLIGWGAKSLKGEISESLKTKEFTIFSQR